MNWIYFPFGHKNKLYSSGKVFQSHLQVSQVEKILIMFIYSASFELTYVLHLNNVLTNEKYPKKKPLSNYSIKKRRVNIRYVWAVHL